MLCRKGAVVVVVLYIVACVSGAFSDIVLLGNSGRAKNYGAR